MKTKKNQFILELIKLIFAIVVGGLLGYYQQSRGNLATGIFEFVIFVIIGTILAKIKIK